MANIANAPGIDYDNVSIVNPADVNGPYIYDGHINDMTTTVLPGMYPALGFEDMPCVVIVGRPGEDNGVAVFYPQTDEEYAIAHRMWPSIMPAPYSA